MQLSRFPMNRLIVLGVLSGFLILLTKCGAEDSAPHSVKENPSGEKNDVDSSAYFESAILNDAASPLPYWNRAAWHLRNARIPEGLQDLDLALEADSTYGPAWSAKADALYLLRQFDPCIEHLDVCLRYSPDHIPCKLRRAEMHIHLNQYEDALNIINSALRLDDQIHDAYWMKGVIYRETGDIENALSSFQTSIEVNPSFFDGYIALGIAYSATSNPLAVDYFNSAMELRPRSVEAKYNCAMYYQELMLEDPSARKIALDKALALYQTIIEIDSTNASAAFNQGFIFLEYLQDYKNADFWFGQAIEKLPYYHQAFFNRGLARESMDMNSSALQDYNSALELKPDFTAAAIAKGRVLNSK